MNRSSLVAGTAGVLLVLGIGTGTGIASAGTARRTEVTFQRNNVEVWGVPRHARESRDALQYIGCSVRQIGSGPARSSCFARDATGRSLTCTNGMSAVGTEAQTEVISAMGPDTLIYFQALDGRCIEVSSNNDSSYLDGPTSVISPAPRASL